MSRSLLSFLLLCCFLCIAPVSTAVAQTTALINQDNFGSNGQNNIFLRSLNPDHRLTFKSQPNYIPSLSKYSLVPNPTFIEWIQTAQFGSEGKTDDLVVAYTRFLKTKALIESDRCIRQYPSFKDEVLGPSDEPCLAFEEVYGAIHDLDNSLEKARSGWGLFYRGIAYARARAFGLALSDLSAARSALNDAGQGEAARAAQGYHDAVLAWQANGSAAFPADWNYPGTCPETPEKGREALGAPTGICTLVHCGNWAGREDPATRRRVTSAVMQSALDGIETNNQAEIERNPMFRCALKAIDMDPLIQADISRSLLKFSRNKGYFKDVAGHFYAVESGLLDAGKSMEALNFLKENLSLLATIGRPHEFAFKYAVDKRIDLNLLATQLGVLAIPLSDQEKFLELKQASLRIDHAFSGLLNQLELDFRSRAATHKYLTSDALFRDESSEGLFIKLIGWLAKAHAGDERKNQQMQVLFSEFSATVAILFDGITHCRNGDPLRMAAEQFEFVATDTLALDGQPAHLREFSEFWRTNHDKINDSIKLFVTAAATQFPAAYRGTEWSSSCMVAIGSKLIFEFEKEVAQDRHNVHFPDIEKLSQLLLSAAVMNNKQTVTDDEKLDILATGFSLIFADEDDDDFFRNFSKLFMVAITAQKQCNQHEKSQKCKLAVLRLVDPIAAMLTSEDGLLFLKPEVLQGLFSRAKKIALSRVKGSDAVGKIWIGAVDQAYREMKLSKNYRTLSHDTQLALSLLVTLHHNFGDGAKAVTPLPFTLPGSAIDEIAFIVRIMSEAGYLRKAISFKTLMSIANRPLQYGLLSLEVVISSLKPSELDALLAFLVQDGGGDIVGNLAFNHMYSSLEFQYMKVFAKYANPLVGADIKTRHPLIFSPRWAKLAASVVPDRVPIGDQDGFGVGVTCRAFNCGVAFQLKGSAAGSNFDAEIRLLEIGLLDKHCSNLEDAMASRQDRTKDGISTDAEEFWQASAAVAVFLNGSCSAKTITQAYQWANQHRNLWPLSFRNRIELSRGLVSVPFVLRDIQIVDEAPPMSGQILSKLELPIGTEVSETSLMDALKRLEKSSLVIDAFPSVQQGTLRLQVVQ